MNINYQNENELSRTWTNLLSNIGTQRPAAVPAPPPPLVDDVLSYLCSLIPPPPPAAPPILHTATGGVPSRPRAPRAPRGGRILDNIGNLPQPPRRPRFRREGNGEAEQYELEIAMGLEKKRLAQEAARNADIARHHPLHQATITKFYTALGDHAAQLNRDSRNREGRELLRQHADADVRHELLRGIQKAIDNGQLTQQNMRSLAGCGRHVIPSDKDSNADSDVSIHAYSGENGKYKYSLVGLQHCGGPLKCPVCSAKIAYVRRDQVRQAVDVMINNEGCIPYFLTLTAPHSKDTDIVDFVHKFREAKGIFGKSTAWKKFAGAVDYQGQIVASEITVDAPWSTFRTGPHFHGHSVVFIRYTLDLQCIEIIKRAFSAAWSEACARVGLVSLDKLTAHKQHGVHFESAHSIECAVDYLIKEVSFEIAPPPLTKNGRRGERLSQWQIMRLATATHPELLPELDSILLALSGVRALFWSAGLKKRCNITSISDKAIAEQPDCDRESSEAVENAEIMKGVEALKIIDIPRWDWGYVCYYGAQRLLVNSLDLLSKGGLIDEKDAKDILSKIINGINPLTGEILRPVMSLHYTYKEYRAAVAAPPPLAAAA